ncbi:TnpV protein [uncultured Ruminococcus sp.]|uniref:TnpV protein n=1 Tax=uncultured Ruminococcus sp. TaxID=165186 RepID=UPI002930CA7A|nr:TnpV protein [uncultured Ruminococcus sp.]
MSIKITYTRQGDYNLPNLKLLEQEQREIGIWGQRRRRYLKERHKILYYNLLTRCKLIDHLTDINEEAQGMYDRLVKQLAEQEGVTEQLKSEDQMLWVTKMNNIRNQAQELVYTEIIYQ